jgi:hypothetical protein
VAVTEIVIATLIAAFLGDEDTSSSDVLYATWTETMIRGIDPIRGHTYEHSSMAGVLEQMTPRVREAGPNRALHQDAVGEIYLVVDLDEAGRRALEFEPIFDEVFSACQATGLVGPQLIVYAHRSIIPRVVAKQPEEHVEMAFSLAESIVRDMSAFPKPLAPMEAQKQKALVMSHLIEAFPVREFMVVAKGEVFEGELIPSPFTQAEVDLVSEWLKVVK